jgi:hypothetical protein
VDAFDFLFLLSVFSFSAPSLKRFNYFTLWQFLGKPLVANTKRKVLDHGYGLYL